MMTKEETEKIIRENFDETINIIEAIKGTYEMTFEEAVLTLQCDNIEKQFSDLSEKVEGVIGKLDNKIAEPAVTPKSFVEKLDKTEIKERTLVKGESTKLSKSIIKTIVICLLTFLIGFYLFMFVNVDEGVFSHVAYSGLVYTFYDITSAWVFSEMWAYLVIPVLIIILAIVNCVANSKVSVEITNKRVTGKVAFGKVVDIPVSKICTVGMGSGATVFVSTPSGKVKFCRLKNKAEVYKAISNLI